MTVHEMEQLLHVVKYYMDSRLRDKVMNELPQAYNSWMGHEVVKVERVNK